MYIVIKSLLSGKSIHFIVLWPHDDQYLHPSIYIIYRVGRTHIILASHHSGPSPNAALLPAQYTLERIPELWAEYRVDNGIEGRIEVSQPQE